MADIVLVAVTLVFIALCVAYISWCDHIIGPDNFGPDAASVELNNAADESARPSEVTA